MVFTKREKAIIAATVAALCLLVLDFYVLRPLLSERDAAQAERERLAAEMNQAKSLFERRGLLGPKWQRMVADGLRGDPAEAESQILRSLRNWCADAGVRLSSLRPDRSAEKKELPEITVHVVGTGSMAAASRLLWRIETARVPAKVKMLTLGSRKDGTDDLSLHLRVSTLYSPAGAGRPEQVAKGPAYTGGNQ